ncbi:uncharacterized protein BKA55DRAFT_53863 [Fusarium redolens]|uniref:Uncharacterized protein n=1 Tax=Fusarium redolens TaxID=48865 RepID=A0A9P9KY41_FUSRE|nr:uncharacterized protein BKA55DRAFT_53863 [Fusarium redolens]KAH7270567.1 hypothetical protein BKA55DRAFT_53863 [Fusarium redolens]
MGEPLVIWGWFGLVWFWMVRSRRTRTQRAQSASQAGQAGRSMEKRDGTSETVRVLCCQITPGPGACSQLKGVYCVCVRVASEEEKRLQFSYRSKVRYEGDKEGMMIRG